jgi:hypothetical protein
MIDLAALESYLKKQGSPLTLSKDDTALPAELYTYLATMPNGKVTLAPTLIDLVGDVLTVSGTTSDNWPVTGMTNVAVVLTSITLTFTNANQETTIQGVANASLPLTSTMSATSLATSIVEYGTAGWKLGLDRQATNVSPLDLIALGALGSLPFEVPQQVTSLLDSAVKVDPGKFEIQFYPGTIFSPLYAFGVYAPGAQWTLIQNVLSFDGISLGAVIQKGAVTVSLASTVTAGSTPIEVGVAINGSPNWSGYVRPPTNTRWPGLIELASWIGGSSLGTETQQGFTGVSFSTSAFDLELSMVELGFNWKKLSLDYLKIASKLTIAGAPVSVFLSLPDLTIAGGLSDGQPVKIVDMLTACSLSAKGVPTDLEISTLSFSAQLKQSVYAVAVGVKHVWKAGPVELEEVYTSINYSKNFGFSGEFGARIKFETKTQPIVFLVQANYLGQTEGWVFSGSNDPSTPIHIGRMIEALAKEFGVDSVPNPVESLTLESISVSYETGTGKFTFECIGTFEVSDQPVKMTVEIEVMSSAGKFSAYFAGRMEVNDLQFDVVFDTKDDSQKLFVADYVNKDASSNSLKSLVSAISKPAGGAIPDNLKIDIREVKLIYYSTKTSQWLFGLGLGIGIRLSDIPGIGSKLPSDLDIGIENLQILYSSKTFTPADVAIVNPLLPTGVRPLPSDGVVQSISFGGALKLGDKTIPISSSVPEKKTLLAEAAVGVIEEDDPVHWISVNRQFGVFQFDRVGLEYNDNVLSFALDAGIAMGPVVFTVVGLKVGSSLSQFEPVFDLSGLALSLTLPSLTIGGAFLRFKQEYYGLAMVQSAAFGFKVLGGWSPSYIDNLGKSHPSSFFLFASINVPLGGPPFFFVTGLAGGFGLNRRLRLPTIQELPTFPLLPANAPKEEKTPIETVKKILPTLAYVFAESEGQYWLAAGIQFTSFEMIKAFALVTVSWGVNLEIAFFGSCAMSLPPGPAQIAYVEILIMASYSTETGLLAIAGVLSPASYVYAGFVKLTGGFAFYTWVAGPSKGDFVVTIGGYGPGYNKPKNYPIVPRVGMSMGLGPLQVIGQAYFALTPGMFMAGIQLKATWSAGPILAWFNAGVDFLIAWAPFHYEGHAYVVIGVRLDLGLFTIKIQVGADLLIWGPEFGGRAEVDLDIVQFAIWFGAEPSPAVPLGWTSFADKFLPKAETAKQASSGLTRARATAAVTNSNVIKATVTSGLQRTVDEILVADPDAFAIDCTSTVPANEAAWNPGTNVEFAIPNTPGDYSKEGKKSASGLYLQSPPEEKSDTEVWNSTLDIGPMDEKDIHSKLELSLTRLTDQGVDELENDVRVMPLLLNSPSALWAPNKEDKSAKEPPHVKFTLVGFKLTPPIVHPSTVNDVPMKELLFQSGISTGFNWESDWVNPEFTVTSVPTKTTLKITVTGKNNLDLNNTDYYLKSLVDTWVVGQRKPILDDLVANGFSTYADDEVDLDRFAKEQALTDWPRVEMMGK